MTVTPPTQEPSPTSSERPVDAAPSRTSRARALVGAALRRPELGSLAGAVFVFVLFGVVAGDQGFLTKAGTINYLEVSAELGVVVVPVTLLAIGGEFDLSVGSMIGFAGIILGVLVGVHGWPLWAAVLVTFAAAAAVGLINGLLVVRTGLSSLIITLAGLFILRGLSFVICQAATGTTSVPGVTDSADSDLIVSLVAGNVGDFPASIVWWIGLTIAATWLLAQTRFGNWVYGSGGDPTAARNVGVPVDRVKVTLFVLTALGAALVAVIQVLGNNQADVLAGQNKEFQAITATVIGGTLLTGGYGSAIGGAIGALIFGMVNQGIFFTGINPDWFQTILGAMLLGAVLVNHYTQRRAVGAR